MEAVAPGKVILTGEHSVVYGKPAIALAIGAHVTADVKSCSNRSKKDWVVKLLGRPPVRYQVADLVQLVTSLDMRFGRFLKSDLSIKAVLKSPEDLLMYALCQGAVLNASESPDDISSRLSTIFPHRLSTKSTIPSGGGMGSSAAAIAAAVRLGEQLGQNELSLEQRMECVRYCERLQHGRGSAIDASAVTFGGKVLVQEGVPKRLDLASLTQGWYLVNSGRTQVSTGECVEHVRRGFAQSQIWSEFEQVSFDLLEALQHSRSVIESIRSNQALLCRLGVVPQRVQSFIEQVEVSGGAAKVSGAGAHMGNNGGLVLVYQPDKAQLAHICKQFSYRFWPLKEESYGVHLRHA